jgi:hypothetical protein
MLNIKMGAPLSEMFDNYKNIPCYVPIKRLAYEGGFYFELLRGEFTGYSSILGKYCFSLYNGETTKLNYSEAKQIFLALF